MNTRTKILLSVVSVAVVNALAIGAITVTNAKSAVVVAAVVPALCALAVVIGLCVANNIAKPLNAAVDMVREMSRGHLGARLNLNRGDEIGVMADAMNALAKNLRINVIGAVNRIALGDVKTKIVLTDAEDEIGAAFKLATDSLRKLIVDDGGRVLAGAAGGDLSQRLTGVYSGGFAVMRDNINAVLQDYDDTLRRAAEAAVSQASGAGFLEEASQSIEAMSAMTKRNADSTKQAKLLADEECAAVSEGDAAVKRVAEVVSQIKAASDNAAKIIKAIDGISAEASLLAFNVDIEAAHVGDDGATGIARVAVEARDLAAHCAEAAKSAADIIEESVKNADDGVKVAEDAEKSISQIIDRAGVVDDLIAEIAETSSKQSRGIKQVSAAVSQMSRIVRRNIAGDFVSGTDADAIEQSSRRDRPIPQKQYAVLPKKRAHKAAALGLMAQARTAGSKELVTIEDCELWR